MAKKVSIAIDGPAGAGKSTIAKRLAKELGYQYVDTGAIYRTVAYFFDLWGVAPKDIDGITRYIDELTIGIEYDEDGVQHMIMNGMDVTNDIRTQEISQKASLVSAHAIVRDMLLDMQRDVAKQHDVIMDGRDIGTVVLPKATVKIFLTASPEVRAKRRCEELLAKGQKAKYEQILKEIQQRDYQDTHREVAKTHNVIMDGRDIGTVVLPKANVKIFLTASAEVRAKRRTDELLAKGQKANYDQILKEIQQRDYQDTHREVAPLKMARDSIKLETSELDIDGVIEAMKKIIGEKIPL